MQNQQTTKGLFKQEIMELARNLGAKSYVVKRTYVYDSLTRGGCWEVWGYDFFKEPADTTSDALTELAHYLSHMNMFVELERPSSKRNINQNFPQETREEQRQDTYKMSITSLYNL